MNTQQTLYGDEYDTAIWFMWSGSARALRAAHVLMLSMPLRAIYYDTFDAVADAYALELANDHDESHNITTRYFAVAN